MSNYPAGVTGYEPAISGYDTREVSVECLREDVSGVPAALVTNLLNYIEQALNPLGGMYLDRPDHLVRDDVARARQRIEKAREVLKAAKGEHVECGFEGDVEGSVEYDTLYWTCPWCGTEHHDNVE